MSEEWKQVLPKVGLGLAVLGATYMLYKSTQAVTPELTEEAQNSEEKPAEKAEEGTPDEPVVEVVEEAAAPVEEVVEDESAPHEAEALEMEKMQEGIQLLIDDIEFAIKQAGEDAAAHEAEAAKAKLEAEEAAAEAQKLEEEAASAEFKDNVQAGIKHKVLQEQVLMKQKAAEERAEKAKAAAAAAKKAQEDAQKKAEQQRLEKVAAAKKAAEAAQKAKEAKEAAAAKVAKEAADKEAAVAKAKADAEAAAAKAKKDAQAAALAKKNAISEGTLTLTCQHAKLLIDTDVVGKMDPYVKFNMIDEKKKEIWAGITEAHYGGGQDPKWNKKFDIPVKNYNHIIKFSILEKDTFSDDFIGEGEFKAVDFQEGKMLKVFHRGYSHDKKETCELYLQGVWTPKE